MESKAQGDRVAYCGLTKVKIKTEIHSGRGRDAKRRWTEPAKVRDKKETKPKHKGEEESTQRLRNDGTKLGGGLTETETR